MAHPDVDYMLLQERRRDELAAAEHSRMVKEALAARRMNAGPRANANPGAPSRLSRLGDALALSLARFLSWTGGWLVGLSCRLRTRVELLRGGMPDALPSPCTD